MECKTAQWSRSILFMFMKTSRYLTQNEATQIVHKTLKLWNSYFAIIEESRLFNIKALRGNIKLLIMIHVLPSLYIKEIVPLPLELEQRPAFTTEKINNVRQVKNLIERNIHYWMAEQSSQVGAIKESLDSAPFRKEPLTNESTERTLFITQANWHLWICSLKKKKRNLLDAIDQILCEGVKWAMRWFLKLQGAIEMMRMVLSRT